MEPRKGDVPPGWGRDALTKFLDKVRANQLGTFANKRGAFERIAAIDQVFVAILGGLSNPGKLLETMLFFRLSVRPSRRGRARYGWAGSRVKQRKPQRVGICRATPCISFVTRNWRRFGLIDTKAHPALTLNDQPEVASAITDALTGLRARDGDEPVYRYATASIEAGVEVSISSRRRWCSYSFGLRFWSFHFRFCGPSFSAPTPSPGATSKRSTQLA
jgi:hypothetical protein